ncbi:MAG: PEP-utilizing enzyme [Ilumatobacteraceae bacterium]
MRDKWITDWPTSQRFPHYTRANAGEVLADPVSPLGWSFGWDGGIVQGYKDGLIRIGAYEEADFDPEHPESVACFGGYFYINLSAIRMQGVRNPAATVEALDQAFFGDHPDVPPYVAHPDDDKPHLTANIDAHTQWVMSGVAWPELDHDRSEAAELRHSRGDLGSYTDAQLVDRARFVQSKLSHLFSQHVVSGSSAAVAPGLLGVVATAIGEPNLPMTLLSSIGDVDSADANYALWALSRLVRDDAELMRAFDRDPDGALASASQSFISAWHDFVVEFGSRGPDEWDLRSPTWETHPQLLLAALDRVRLQSDDESPQLRHTRKAEQRDELIRQARSALAGNPDVAPLLDLGLSAGKMMAHRERTKTTIVRVLHEARVAFRELGRRHGHDELIFQLLDDEIDDYLNDPRSFDRRLRERHAEWTELFALEPPFIIANASVAPLGQWPRKNDGDVAVASVGEVLTGVAGSPGVARGIARVILDPADPGDLGPGDILVAPCTDPSWTPLFMTSAAVVVNVGGQISHAVIVSRELGVPCVVSVNDATKRITDGSLIEVNGNTGLVTIVG